MSTSLRRGVTLGLASLLLIGGGVATASPASASPRTDYLDTARYLDPSLYDVTDRSLWKVGKSVCKMLDRGAHFVDVLDFFNRYDLPTETQAAIVVAAVNHLCPGHEYFLDEWINS